MNIRLSENTSSLICHLSQMLQWD